MNVNHRFVVLFILVMFMPAPDLASADVVPIGVGRSPAGGGAAPTGPHENIRMDSEEVTIRLLHGRYTVDAVFHFSNAGEMETLWVGFPKRITEGRVLPIVSDFYRFDAWVNGEKVPFVDVKTEDKEPEQFESSDKLSWLAQHITFQGHERTTIRVNYEAGYAGGAHYIYGTGAYWNGSIRRAVFTIDASETGGTKRIRVTGMPRGALRSVTRNLLRCEIRDLEPRPDDCIEVGIDWRHTVVEP